MKIRAYTSIDKNAVLQLFELNTPQFFDQNEKEDLERYLSQKREEYFIIENNSQIIGAGGINYFLEERIARISWDIIHPHYQGKGIGKLLTKYRLEIIGKNPNIDFVVVRTSQFVFEFYNKMGFKLDKIESDFWAKGIHLYQMKQPSRT